MKNTIRGTLVLALVMVACGDDAGGDDDNDGDSGTLTLDEALSTNGVDVSQARVDLVFPAACEEQRKCKTQTQAACLSENQDPYEAMASARSTACRDATLDLYACFAVTPCAEYDTDDECNELGTKQEEACK